MNVSGRKGSGAILGMTWGDSLNKYKEKSQLLWAGAHDLSFEQHPSVNESDASHLRTPLWETLLYLEVLVIGGRLNLTLYNTR